MTSTSAYATLLILSRYDTKPDYLRRKAIGHIHAAFSHTDEFNGTPSFKSPLEVGGHDRIKFIIPPIHIERCLKHSYQASPPIKRETLF